MDPKESPQPASRSTNASQSLQSKRQPKPRNPKTYTSERGVALAKRLLDAVSVSLVVYKGYPSAFTRATCSILWLWAVWFLDLAMAESTDKRQTVNSQLPTAWSARAGRQVERKKERELRRKAD